MIKDNKFIIGIAGGSASGKSTLSDILAQRLSQFKVNIIHSDNYYKSVLPKIISPRSGIEYDDYNHPDALDKEKLIEELNNLIESDADVIIVDSLFTLYYEEIRNKLDLKIFIYSPSDERLARRLKRNMQWGLSFDVVADYYLDCVKYRHDEFVEPTRIFADIVLNNIFTETALQIIINTVQNKLS